jgi:carboxymethylenebutenolidase
LTDAHLEATVKERLLQLPADGATLPVFITHPEENGPFPAVILYMDFWGVREELYDLARRIATVGYYCMVPDFYYRQGTIRTAYRDNNGRMISVHLLSEEQRLKALAPMHKLTDEMVMQDTGVILEFLKSGEPAREGAMGCIGYCQGGRHVVQAGARYPERFRAMASFHPTTLVTESDNSPHLQVGQLRGEIYFGLAELDRHSPPAMIEALGRALAGCEVAHRIEVHKGADHGYALPDRDIHDKRAALRDWEMIFAMLHRQIPPYAG